MGGIKLSSFIGSGTETRGTVVVQTEGRGIKRAAKPRTRIAQTPPPADTLAELEAKIKTVVEETQGK